MQLCKHSEPTFEDDETHIAVLRTNFIESMCEVTVMTSLLTARVAISYLYIQVRTYINELHMLSVVCVSASEHFIVSHI